MGPNPPRPPPPPRCSVDPVEVERRGGLLVEIEHLRKLALHAEGQLVGRDQALDLGILAEGLRGGAVQLLHVIELHALGAQGAAGVPQVADLLAGAKIASADPRPLVDGRQERRAVVRRAAVVLRRADGDEARQVFVRGAQAVEDPRSEAGPGELGNAAVHLQERLGVVGQVGVHAVEQAELVGMARQLGEEFADPQAALAVLGEPERRAEEPAAAESAPSARGRLAVIGGELGFVVKRIDVAGPAFHAEEDHALRPRREVGLLRRQRIGIASGSPGRPARAPVRQTPGSRIPSWSSSTRSGERASIDSVVERSWPACRSRPALAVTFDTETPHWRTAPGKRHSTTRVPAAGQRRHPSSAVPGTS